MYTPAAGRESVGHDFGYPELLVHETNGVREWRNEFWFQAEEAAVAFGVLVIDGVQGRNAFGHEALVRWSKSPRSTPPATSTTTWTTPRSSTTMARCSARACHCVKRW